MALQPEISKKKNTFRMKTCNRCKQSWGEDEFAPTKSDFYPDGVIPVCNDCVNKWISEYEDSDDKWNKVDRLCRWADVPFVPQEWERIEEMNDKNVFYRYAEIFGADSYDDIDWSDYYKAFKQLKEQGSLEKEIPLLGEEKKSSLKEKWGSNYDDEALNYLENLYTGMMNTQNVNGALQKDQAYKICKMSYEIDCRIREGSDFDKLLSSYDKLVKAAEFTPKNVKNINDFDTCGELIKWLEKRGWKNPYYDNVPRDVVDETIANIQNFNQRLYTNESGIGEEITHRIESLKTAEQLERGDYYDTGTSVQDLDSYEADGYDKLIKGTNDQFSVED